MAREERLRPRVVASDQAQEAWGKVRAALVDCLPESTFGLWIDPLHLVGEVNGALWLDAPIRIAAWTERRYAHLIGDAIRGLSDYRGLYLGRQEEADKDDGLL